MSSPVPAQAGTARAYASAALGAARLARLCLGGERMEDVCVPPAIDRVVQPDAELAALLAVRRRTFVQLYQDLKNSFVESSA